MTLFLNCCPREDSRTERLARALLAQLGAYTEKNLFEEPLLPLNRERLERRTALVEQQSFEDPMFLPAKEFAAADRIVIAAPFWDGSFPAQLKIYLENIYITGIVSRYGADGRPEGMCRAKELYYVTTAGGPFDPSFGYDYVKCLAQQYFGIPQVKLIAADMLDIVVNDPEQILQEAMKQHGLTP